MGKARRVVLGIALTMVACSSSTEQSPSIYGDWLYASADGKSGVSLTFKQDNSYVFSRLLLTSETSAEAEVETGTFTDSGSTITFTPKQWTCPGPDPVTSVGRSFAGGNLLFSLPSGLITLKPNNSTGDGTAFAVVYGCFKAGTFVKADLAPVDN